MELCAGGELFDRIIDSGHFGEKDAALLMQQILRGVNYMHWKRVTHRDLKPENFLLTTKEAVSKAHLKIIDFGLAHDFPEPGDFLKTNAGSSYYIAPEIMKARYDQKADMWSCGVITYVLLCGSPPFPGETDSEILAKVKEGKYSYEDENWNGVSKDAKGLIDHLLELDVGKRLDAESALNHKWVADKAPAATPGRRGSVLDNLRSFQGLNKFKKAALQVVATEMSDAKIEALRSTFIALDTNGDGRLSAAEVRDGLAKMGMQNVPADLKEVLQGVDADSNGSIEYKEFISAGLDKRLYLEQDVCWAAFCLFDKDGNGKISKDEIAQVLASSDVQAVAHTDLSDIMRAVDTNGDGEIDFDEFMKMMRS